MFGKAAAVPILERHGHTLAFVERGRDRVREPPAVSFRGGEPVDHHEHLSRLSHAMLGVRLIQPHHGPVELGAHEARRAQLGGELDIGAVGAGRQGEGDDNCGLRIADCGLLVRSPACRIRNRQSAIRNQCVHHLLHRIRLHLMPALHAMLRSYPGPQQPQKIVDLGRGPDR